MTDEIWKPVGGWDGYDISNYGRVRSWRLGKSGRSSEPRIRKLHADYSGHFRAQLSRNGRLHSFFVHRLVIQEFVEPCPPGLTDCAHLDGNPGNNHVSNLKWTTRQENCLHKNLHGTMPRGESRMVGKMNEERVMSLRRQFRDGGSVRKLMIQFNISESVCRGILKGHEWKHVSMEGLPVKPKALRSRLSKTDEAYLQQIEKLRAENVALRSEIGRLRAADWSHSNGGFK